MAVEEDTVGENVTHFGGAKDVRQTLAQFLCGRVVEDA
jgi:hypothetical protein